MCVVSMVMDHYHDKWTAPQPVWWPNTAQTGIVTIVRPAPTPAEVEEFRVLLERAREYDRKHNQPDCELEEKRQKVKKLAEELGIEIGFL